jgi:serine protease inhibitor
MPAFGADEAKIDDVFQAALLEFDEKGAKGAAVTAVVVKTRIRSSRPQPKPEPLIIKCDHPFSLGVADHKSGLFLLAAVEL